MRVSKLETAVVVGVAVWLAGLMGAILLRSDWERKKRGDYWVPLAAYLAASTVAMVIAGIWHHRHAERAESLVSKEIGRERPTEGRTPWRKSPLPSKPESSLSSTSEWGVDGGSTQQGRADAGSFLDNGRDGLSP